MSRDKGVRERLGWGDSPVILTVGRLQKRKGHDRMILAIGAIRKAFPEALYVIVGDGEEREALRQLVAHVRQDEHVRFVGELDDKSLIECYQQCDLFSLPNRQVGWDIEGFGMVLLEAQACGRPVLAGASGGTAETMRIPETGRVVPCEDPEVIAAEVIDLLSDRDRLDRMGAAARHWVVDQFDWEALSRRASLLFGMPQGEPVSREPAEVLDP
jgi:phosphatidylinositol alpha-1,6-mannosyltransferase